MSRWRPALLERAPEADVYFRPEYVMAYQANGDGGAGAALATADGAWLYVPYLACPVPWAAGICDIQGTYGYGGPLAGGATPDFLAAAWRAIEGAWREMGAVAAFLRLHPLEENAALLGPGWEVVPERATASIDLGDGLAAAFAGGAGANHRNMVARAARLGLSAACQPVTAPVLARFLDVYRATMARLKADRYYYFSAAYFEALAALGDRLSCIEVADPGGQTLSMALVLWGPRWAHYHLAGRTDAAPGCAGNLVLQTAATEAAARGLEAVHLGGGLTNDPEDPLWRFKQRIGRGRHRFATARRALDPAGYADLIAAWRERHGGVAPVWFLGYRQP